MTMTTFDLVFEGGGAKGMAFVGAMQEFEARGFTYDRLLGTSTGAITATLLAARYNAQEMLAALNERINGQPVFAGFLDTPRPFSLEEARSSAVRQFLRNFDLPFVPANLQEAWGDGIVASMLDQSLFRHLISFDERGGWFAADRFLDWLAHKLDEGLFGGQPRRFSQLNLVQFFQATGRELSLVASDTSGQRMLVLNHRTAPQCPLIWAVRMSMSLPLLWQEVEWQADWGAYRGEDITGHIVVDGGLLSNFPIELLISDMPHVTAVMGPKGDAAVLGFLIDESLPVPEAPPPAIWPAGAPGMEGLQSFQFGSLRTVQRINRLINTATAAHDKMVIEAFDDLVVRLPAQSYSVTEFDMSDARRNALINAARQATQVYFDRQAPPAAPLGVEVAEPEAASRTADRIATHMLEP